MIQRLLALRGYRELILNFVLRDVKEKYRGTVLGYFWTLVTPLTLMGIFVIIFTYIFPVDVPQYPVYVIIGLLSWNFFSSSLYDAVHSIRGGAELLKKVYFPAEIYPISAVITNLLTFSLSLLVLVPFVISYNISINVRVLWVPVIAMWQAALCLGLGMITALANVYFRDTGPLVGTGVHLWFYASPIFYTTSIMPHKIMMLYFLNPAAVIIELYRWAIMGNVPPTGLHLVVCGIVTVSVLMIGVVLYSHWGRHIPKVV